MKKTEVMNILRGRFEAYEKGITNYGMDKGRALDQAYGFMLGVEAVTKCDEYFDEITEMWETWRSHILYETEPGIAWK